MYQIDNFPEVWADACLRDSEGRFLFLSIYGRDTALLQFMAAMELPRADNGLDRFTLIDPATSDRHAIDVAGTERLSKLSTRLPRDTVFGALTQTWIYDTAVATPDIVNRQGWALSRSPVGALPPVVAGKATPMDTFVAAGKPAVPGPSASADVAHPAVASTPLDDRLWALMKHLAPVPLLDPWRNGLMALAREAGMIRPIGDSTYPALGPVTGGRVSLDDRFLPMVRDLVGSGAIVLPPSASSARSAGSIQRP